MRDKIHPLSGFVYNLRNIKDIANLSNTHVCAPGNQRSVYDI